VTQQCQTTNQQTSRPNLQISKENEVQNIPTIVNGVIQVNNNVKSNQKYTDSIEDTTNTLSQSINKRNGNFALLNKRRVILIGDSHLKGYSCNLSSLAKIMNYIV
jgi:hypothetical protein